MRRGDKADVWIPSSVKGSSVVRKSGKGKFQGMRLERDRLELECELIYQVVL